jgi:formyl-CoA transferase
MVAQEMFKPLDRPPYEKNAGRIADVRELNRQINAITRKYTTEQLLELFNAITVPISKIKSVPEVIEDPLVARRLLHATDAVTGTRITLAPPPYTTPYLERSGGALSFPPRFGEQNQEIYGGRLGRSAEELSRLKEKGII